MSTKPYSSMIKTKHTVNKIENSNGEEDIADNISENSDISLNTDNKVFNGAFKSLKDFNINSKNYNNLGLNLKAKLNLNSSSNSNTNTKNNIKGFKPLTITVREPGINKSSKSISPLKKILNNKFKNTGQIKDINKLDTNENDIEDKNQFMSTNKSSSKNKNKNYSNIYLQTNESKKESKVNFEFNSDIINNSECINSNNNSNNNSKQNISFKDSLKNNPDTIINTQYKDNKDINNSNNTNTTTSTPYYPNKLYVKQIKPNLKTGFNIRSKNIKTKSINYDTKADISNNITNTTPIDNEVNKNRNSIQNHIDGDISSNNNLNDIKKVSNFTKYKETNMNNKNNNDNKLNTNPLKPASPYSFRTNQQEILESLKDSSEINKKNSLFSNINSKNKNNKYNTHNSNNTHHSSESNQQVEELQTGKFALEELSNQLSNLKNHINPNSSNKNSDKSISTRTNRKDQENSKNQSNLEVAKIIQEKIIEGDSSQNHTSTDKLINPNINISSINNIDKENKQLNSIKDTSPQNSSQQRFFNSSSNQCILSKLEKGIATFVSEDDIIFSLPSCFLPKNSVIGNTYQLNLGETMKMQYRVNTIQKLQKKYAGNVYNNNDN